MSEKATTRMAIAGMAANAHFTMKRTIDSKGMSMSVMRTVSEARVVWIDDIDSVFGCFAAAPICLNDAGDVDDDALGSRLLHCEQ